MRFFVATLFAAVSAIAQAQVVQGQAADDVYDSTGRRLTLHERIRADSVPVDHVARIGKYDYKIYVDRGVAPFDVAAIITDESRSRLGNYDDPQVFVADVKRHRVLVIEYMNSLRGTPSPSTVPEPQMGSDAAAPPPPPPEEGCPDIFPKSVWNKDFKLGNDHVSIGLTGLPAGSWVDWSVPAVPVAINKTCQGKVGKLGGRIDDDGGHLIGAQLGGWNKRANLVPQNINLNRGLWRKMQDEVAQCAINGYGAYHRAIPAYDPVANPPPRPHSFSMVTLINQLIPPFDQYDGGIGSIPNEVVNDYTRADFNRVILGMQKFCQISCPPPLPGADASCKV